MFQWVPLPLPIQQGTRHESTAFGHPNLVADREPCCATEHQWPATYDAIRDSKWRNRDSQTGCHSKGRSDHLALVGEGPSTHTQGKDISSDAPPSEIGNVVSQTVDGWIGFEIRSQIDVCITNRELVRARVEAYRPTIWP